MRVVPAEVGYIREDLDSAEALKQEVGERWRREEECEAEIEKSVE